MITARLPVTLAAVGMAALACAAAARAQPIYSFADMPNGAFLDVDPPTAGCNTAMPTIVVPASGHTVTITTTRGSDFGQPYFMGCFDYSTALVSFHLPVDPAVNPGNFRGHYQEGTQYGDLILDFSEPLTGFGISAMLDSVLSNANRVDTIVVYDGPTASGNVLGTVTTPAPPATHVLVSFIGVVTPTAQIRSARVVVDPKFCIDGYAVAPLSSACPADLDNGSGTGAPDGGVDINDLLFFLAAFEAGSTAADLDNGSGTGAPDGGVDINDLLFFLAHFEQGC